MSDDKIRRLPGLGAEGANDPVVIYPPDAPERMRALLDRARNLSPVQIGRPADAYYSEARSEQVTEIFRLGHWESMVISIALAQLVEHPTTDVAEQTQAIQALQRIFGTEGTFVLQVARPAP